MCKGSIFTSFAIALESDPIILIPFLLSDMSETGVPRGFLSEFCTHLEGAEEEAMLVSIFTPILKNLVQTCRSLRLMDPFTPSGRALRILTSVPAIAKLAVLRVWVIKDPNNYQFSLLSREALEVKEKWGTYPADCLQRMSGRDMIWTFLGCLMDVSTIGDQGILRQYFITPSQRKVVDVRKNTGMLRHKLSLLRGELSGIGMFSFLFFLSFFPFVLFLFFPFPSQ